MKTKHIYYVPSRISYRTVDNMANVNINNEAKDGQSHLNEWKRRWVCKWQREYDRSYGREPTSGW